MLRQPLLPGLLIGSVRYAVEGASLNAYMRLFCMRLFWCGGWPSDGMAQ